MNIQQMSNEPVGEVEWTCNILIISILNFYNSKIFLKLLYLLTKNILFKCSHLSLN